MRRPAYEPSPQVKPVVHSPFGIKLKKLGMSPQRPLYRSWKQDPQRVEKWKREEYPAIRARAAQVGATILFADEASVRTTTTLAPQQDTQQGGSRLPTR
jgi:Winged helix-turn helix